MMTSTTKSMRVHRRVRRRARRFTGAGQAPGLWTGQVPVTTEGVGRVSGSVSFATK